MNPATIIKTVLNAAARGSDDIARFLGTHGDDLITAIRSGNAEDFLKGVKGGDSILNSTGFMRTMAKLGDNLQYLDEVSEGLQAGTRIDPTDFLGRLGINAGDDVGEAMTRSIARFNETAADVAGGVARNADEIQRARELAARNADNTATAADDVVEAGARAAENAPGLFRRILGRKISVGDKIVMTTVGVGVPVSAIAIEVESGGAISQFTVEALFDAAEYAKENGIPFADETLNAAATAARKVSEYANFKFTMGTNLAVKAALGEFGDGEGPTETNIRNAKNLAMGAQLMDPAGIAFDLYFLQRENRIQYGDLPETRRDELLAEAVIDRLVERCAFNALEDHPVTRDDLIEYMIAHRGFMQIPGIADTRVEAALVAHIPELGEPLPGEPETALAGGSGHDSLTDQLRGAAADLGGRASELADGARGQFQQRAGIMSGLLTGGPSLLKAAGAAVVALLGFMVGRNFGGMKGGLVGMAVTCAAAMAVYTGLKGNLISDFTDSARLAQNDPEAAPSLRTAWNPDTPLGAYVTPGRSESAIGRQFNENDRLAAASPQPRHDERRPVRNDPDGPGVDMA